MGDSVPPTSRRLRASFAVVCIVVAGCGGCDSGDDSAGPSAGSSSPSATADPVAQIRSTFTEYWNVVAQTQSGKADPADALQGLATEATVQHNVDLVQRYTRQAIVRSGEPKLSHIDVEVGITGRSATVTACVDESAWRAEVAGNTLPLSDEQRTPYPVAFEMVASDGSWLVGESKEPEGASSCSGPTD